MLHPSCLDTPRIGYNRFVLTTYKTDNTIMIKLKMKQAHGWTQKVYEIDYWIDDPLVLQNRVKSVPLTLILQISNFLALWLLLGIYILLLLLLLDLYSLAFTTSGMVQAEGLVGGALCLLGRLPHALAQIALVIEFVSILLRSRPP